MLSSYLRALLAGPRTPRPKVFGLGLSKTGTKSLGAALTMLGFRNKSYDSELLTAWSTGNKMRLFEVIGRYDSFEDWPFPLAFREIMDRFGDSSRYVLTVRKEPKIWLESLKTHALRSPPKNRRFRQMAYGHDYPQGAEEEHLSYYERHNAEVRLEIKRRNLSHVFAELCWERGDGWPQICRLIESEPPNRPFPYANRTAGNAFDPYHVALNEERIRHLRL